MHAPGMAVSDDTVILPADKANVRSWIQSIAPWPTCVRVLGPIGTARPRPGAPPVYSAACARRRGRRVEASRASTAMKCPRSHPWM